MTHGNNNLYWTMMGKKAAENSPLGSYYDCKTRKIKTCTFHLIPLMLILLVINNDCCPPHSDN